MKEQVPVGGGGPETEISAVETFETKMQKNPVNTILLHSSKCSVMHHSVAWTEHFIQ